MNSDFSKAKIGDWAWTINAGWCKITRVNSPGDFPLRIGGSGYSVDGKFTPTDKAPSAFVIPPAEFTTTDPPPCEFKEGDKVVVWNSEVDKYRAYFSHFAGDKGRYHCFIKGDKWSSEGNTIGWRYCEKWEGENEIRQTHHTISACGTDAFCTVHLDAIPCAADAKPDCPDGMD